MGHPQPRAVGSVLVRKGKPAKKARKHKERHERQLEDVRIVNGQKVLIVYKNNSLELNFSAEIPFGTQKIERKGNKTEIRKPLSSHPSNITGATGRWIRTITGQTFCCMACAPSGIPPFPTL